MDKIDKDFRIIAVKYLKDNEIIELYSVVEEIIEHKEFQKRKDYLHHDDSVFEHSIHVCMRALKIAKKLPFKYDYKAIAIGSLLHDFYYDPWQSNKKKRPLSKMHAFVHANEASNNSRFYFSHLTDDRIHNIIKTHMWPITFREIPLYKESWIVTLSDKIESLKCFKNPKKIPIYLGIK